MNRVKRGAASLLFAVVVSTLMAISLPAVGSSQTLPISGDASAAMLGETVTFLGNGVVSGGTSVAVTVSGSVPYVGHSLSSILLGLSDTVGYDAISLGNTLTDLTQYIQTEGMSADPQVGAVIVGRLVSGVGGVVEETGSGVSILGDGVSLLGLDVIALIPVSDLPALPIPALPALPALSSLGLPSIPGMPDFNFQISGLGDVLSLLGTEVSLAGLLIESADGSFLGYFDMIPFMGSPIGDLVFHVERTLTGDVTLVGVTVKDVGSAVSILEKGNLTGLPVLLSGVVTDAGRIVSLTGLNVNRIGGAVDYLGAVIANTPLASYFSPDTLTNGLTSLSNASAPVMNLLSPSTLTSLLSPTMITGLLSAGSALPGLSALDTSSLTGLLSGGGSSVPGLSSLTALLDPSSVAGLV
ncbi:MAG: hypothetical protein PHY31_00580, partial [Smithellaceae bacterium]|nr:hypothetical protein [Smithellaceae bacterium]